MVQDINTKLTPLLFVAGLALPGAYSIAKVEVHQPDLDPLKGAYQRAYETSFVDAFPMTFSAQALLNTATLALFGEANSEVVIGQGDWLFTSEEFRPPEEAPNFAAILQDTRTRLAEHEIELLPVIVPDKARIYTEKLPRARSGAIETRYESALSAVRAQGFVGVDLTSALLAGRQTSETFMRTDTHWSPAGASLAAKELADATGLIKAGNSDVTTQTLPNAPFDGDLMPFVETGPFAPWVGIEPEEIGVQQTVLTQDNGLGLFGEADIGIVLVGTSFSARAEFNFAGALSQATGLEVVNLATQGQGPFTPMVEALDAGTILEINPRFVVWEIPERYLSVWSSK